MKLHQLYNYFFNNLVHMITLLWCLKPNFNIFSLAFDKKISLPEFLMLGAPYSLNSYRRIETSNSFIPFSLYFVQLYIHYSSLSSNSFINSQILFSWNWPDTSHSRIISAFQLRDIRPWQASLGIVSCRKATPVGVDANNTHLTTSNT